jgi:hypothetical protein
MFFRKMVDLQVVAGSQGTERVSTSKSFSKTTALVPLHPEVVA